MQRFICITIPAAFAEDGNLIDNYNKWTRIWNGIMCLTNGDGFILLSPRSFQYLRYFHS